MKEKADLTPEHIATIIARARIVAEIIKPYHELQDIIYALNQTGYVAYCLAKGKFETCKFKFYEGAVWYKVYGLSLDLEHAYYVEILSKESVKIA